MGSGFRLQRRLARLTFTGNEKLEGAEVTVRIGIPIADVLNFDELAASEEPKEKLALLKMFSEKMLVSWNLEDEAGKPIPSQPDGMLRIPAEEAAIIMGGWAEALGKVPGPLGVRSPDGVTSEGVLLRTGHT